MNFPTDGDSDKDEGLEDLSDMSGEDDDSDDDEEEDSGQCFHAVYHTAHSFSKDLFCRSNFLGDVEILILLFKWSHVSFEV